MILKSYNNIRSELGLLRTKIIIVMIMLCNYFEETQEEMMSEFCVLTAMD